MFEKGIRTTVESLLALDPVVCDRRELERIVELSARVRGWVDAIDVAVARRVASNATRASTPPPPRSWAVVDDAPAKTPKRLPIGPRCATSFRRSKMHSPTAPSRRPRRRTRQRHPPSRRRRRSELAALEADLLAAASRDTIAEFDKDCRDLARLLAGDGGVGELDRQKSNSTVRRWIDKITGMWHLHAEVDPETGAKLWTAIDAQLDTVKQRDGNAEIPLERLTVVALVEVVGATPATTANAGCRRCACTSTCRRWSMGSTPVDLRDLERRPAPGRHDPPAVLRSRHHPSRVGRRR